MATTRNQRLRFFVFSCLFLCTTACDHEAPTYDNCPEHYFNTIAEKLAPGNPVYDTYGKACVAIVPVEHIAFKNFKRAYVCSLDFRRDGWPINSEEDKRRAAEDAQRKENAKELFDFRRIEGEGPTIRGRASFAGWGRDIILLANATGAVKKVLYSVENLTQQPKTISSDAGAAEIISLTNSGEWFCQAHAEARKNGFLMRGVRMEPNCNPQMEREIFVDRKANIKILSDIQVADEKGSTRIICSD